MRIPGMKVTAVSGGLDRRAGVKAWKAPWSSWASPTWFKGRPGGLRTTDNIRLATAPRTIGKPDPQSKMAAVRGQGDGAVNTELTCSLRGKDQFVTPSQLWA